MASFLKPQAVVRSRTSASSSATMSVGVDLPTADRAETQMPVTWLIRPVRYRRPLAIAYGLLCFENLLRLLQPLVLGLAINGLLKGSYDGLLLVIAQHLGYLLVGTVRQMYSARVLARIQTDLVVDSDSNEQTSAGNDLLHTTEDAVPLVIHTAFSLVGGLACLAIYDPMLLPLCLLLVLPAGLLNAAFGRQMILHSAGGLDQERGGRGARFESGAAGSRSLRERLYGWRVRQSDFVALRFAMMELFVLGVLAAVLAHYCTGLSGSGTVPQAGDIYAVFHYLFIFIVGLESVPLAAGELARCARSRDEVAG